MSHKHLEDCMAKNGTLEIAHILRNGLTVCRKLIRDAQIHPEQIIEYTMNVDHRLQGMEQGLQALIDRARGNG